jgi:uncharacterized glyoxalase superfamily protein PhnB
MYQVSKIEVTMVVESIEETTRWYERVLGWSSNFDVFETGGHALFGSVMMGDIDRVARGEEPFRGFNLVHSPDAKKRRGKGVVPDFTAWIFVDDADAVYRRVVENGVKPESEPQNEAWGARVFSMRDLNGFALAFLQQLDQATVEKLRQEEAETSEEAELGLE